MKICYFGAYDREYSKNKINMRGLEENNVDIIECHVGKPKINFESKFSFALFIIIYPLVLPFRNLYSLVKGIYLSFSNPYDIIFVAYPGQFDVPAAYALSKITGKPIVFDAILSSYDIFVNDRKLIKENSLIAKALFISEKLIYKMCNLIFVESGSDKIFFEKTFAIPSSKIDVSYLGADDKIYHTNKQSDFDTHDKFIVAFYGFHSPLHGVEYMLRAAKMCEEDSSIHFIFIGGGGQTYASDVILSKELNLRNVSFLKLTETNGALDVISKADIMLGVFENNNDTGLRAIPNKVFQGLAMGKAVVTSYSKGTTEFFTHKKNIYLCQAGNALFIANAIMELRSNNALRDEIAQNGHDLYLKHFTPKAIAGRIIEICNITLQNIYAQ